MILRSVLTDQRRFEAGAVVPWYFGLAYYDFNLREGVFYVVPVNLAVRLAKTVGRLWSRFRFGRSANDLRAASLIARAHARGYDSGVESGILRERARIAIAMEQEVERRREPPA